MVFEKHIDFKSTSPQELLIARVYTSVVCLSTGLIIETVDGHHLTGLTLWGEQWAVVGYGQYSKKAAEQSAQDFRQSLVNALSVALRSTSKTPLINLLDVTL